MYSLFIYLYSFAIRIVAFFGQVKAKQLSGGQKQVWMQIETRLQQNERRIWIHCASLGEFEQGRPLNGKKTIPEQITFFASLSIPEVMPSVLFN